MQIVEPSETYNNTEQGNTTVRLFHVPFRMLVGTDEMAVLVPMRKHLRLWIRQPEMIACLSHPSIPYANLHQDSPS